MNKFNGKTLCLNLVYANAMLSSQSAFTPLAGLVHQHCENDLGAQEQQGTGSAVRLVYNGGDGTFLGLEQDPRFNIPLVN